MAYTVKQLAELWSCSPKQIYNLIKEGKLVPFHIGVRKGIRFTDDAIAKCMGREPDPPPPPGHVYFVDCGAYTKIGYASDWKKRLDSLQTSNPERLNIWAIMPGDIPREREIHELLGAFRRNREWFELGADGRSAAEQIIRASDGVFMNGAQHA